MKRQIYSNLLEWKAREDRLPLILRGARQVGKSYIINQFGKSEFSEFIEVNFDYRPELKAIFDTLNPDDITRKLSVLLNVRIQPGETLLFLDEIQECPAAIQSLRYFKEKMPKLHVIAAGSLLEFVLDSESIEIPVGRVQYMYLRPMSFMEFLEGTNQSQLAGFIRDFDCSTIDNSIHNLAITALRDYLVIGGMPDVVSVFRRSRDYQECADRQYALLKTYYDDFNKYSKKKDVSLLQDVFQKASKLIGTHVKYSTIDPEQRAARVKLALFSLEKAGLLHRVRATTASGFPLDATEKERKYKLLFLDVGLASRAAGLSAELLLDLSALNKGNISEQFVGQELIALQSPIVSSSLFFWFRNKKSSQAEVDYVWERKLKMIPMEVKSGTTGRLKSLQLFLSEKNMKRGLKVSESPWNDEFPILSIPMYLMPVLDRIVDRYF